MNAINKDIETLKHAGDQVGIAMSPLLTRLIYFEIATNVALIVGLLCLSFLFYTKKNIFPKCMIVYLVAQHCLLVLDYLVASMAVSSLMGSEGVLEFMRPFITAVIWIPYLLNSRRVKATFVRQFRAFQAPSLRPGPAATARAATG